ncbi:Hypothetical protein EIN_020070, partial [Entamoeba invadens IP1]
MSREKQKDTYEDGDESDENVEEYRESDPNEGKTENDNLVSE